MADTNEALKIWQALQPMIDREIAEQTESCVRAKKMIVRRRTEENADGDGVTVGVSEPYGDRVIIPSGTQMADVMPGEPVWVYWYMNNASTMHVALNGDGSQGTADTDRLRREMESIQVDLEGVYSYIDQTASHLRLEFTDEVNGLRSYLEMTASRLRVEFHDDLNSMRSYLEMTASHLRIAFENDIASMRSYLELTASHLRLEFYNDMESLRSYLEMTASHLRIEFADDINSLRSYLELTASNLRIAFENDMESMRSYLLMTASQLRVEFENDISSLRSYVDIQAGKIDMNVAATDENSNILRQAGMYINEQGVLVYATDNANNIGSKLNVLSNEISAKVGKSEVVITDDSITIGSQSISLKGYVTLDTLAAGTTYINIVRTSNLIATNAEIGGRTGSWQTPTMGNATVDGSVLSASQLKLDHYHAITAEASGGVVTITLGAAQSTPGTDFFNIADTQFYIDGVAAARTAGYTQGQRDWRPDNIRISGKNVIVLNAASDDIGGPYSAASIYDAGYEDGAASAGARVADSVSVTLSTVSGPYSSSGYGTVYYDNGDFTEDVLVEADTSAAYNSGKNSVTISESDLGLNGTPTYLPNSKRYSVPIIATASNGKSATQTVMVDATAAWNAGAASVSQRSVNYISVSLGTVVSPTVSSGYGTVYYDDGSYTSSVFMEANTSAAYNSGKNSVTISNSDIVRDGEDDYNTTTHDTRIYIEATASNGAQGTQSFVVSGANAYMDGQNSVYVSGWSVDKSSLPTVTVTVTLSNGVVRSYTFNV